MFSWFRKRQPSRSRDELEAIAHEISPVLVRELLPQAREYYSELGARNGKAITQPGMWEVQLEDLFYSLNLLDRAVLDRLGAINRAVFMDAVFANVCESLRSTHIPEAPEPQFRSWFKEELNARQQEYGAWRLPRGEELKGTIFWEFGKKMTHSLLGIYNPVEVFMLSHRAAESLKMLFELVDKTVVANPRP
jgi:hypothetical protein